MQSEDSNMSISHCCSDDNEKNVSTQTKNNQRTKFKCELLELRLCAIKIKN